MMRLRLTVKRHGLPDAAVVWAIETSENPTISQLLEQVNDIIPLESDGEWGLEDYAVEVGGKERNYECLHFQPVTSILHEDDEVIVRPLLTQDLNQRRASGRHQITFDGKHLFDGAVFGRPRRRAIADRPQVRIPPRKRRRITYIGEDDLEDDGEDMDVDLKEGPPAITDSSDDAVGNRQLVIRADFENEDDEDEDEDDGDDDFEPPKEDLEDDLSVDQDELDEELEALNAEPEELGTSNEEDKKQDTSRDASQQADTPDLLAHSISQLREAFPKAPLSVCKHVLQNCDMNIGAAFDTLMKGFKPEKSRSGVKAAIRTAAKEIEALPPRRNQAVPVELPERESDPIAEDDAELDQAGDEDHDEEASSSDGGMAGYYDHHGLPPGSINIGKGLSDTAKSIIAQATNIPLPPSRSSKLKRSNSVGSNKSVRFAEETPKVQPVSDMAVDDDSEDSDDEDFDVVSSSDDDESDISSNSDSNNSDSSPVVSEAQAVSSVPAPPESEDETSSSGSDSDSDSSSSESDSDSSSDSDSDSSSDSDSDSEPEEASSKAPITPQPVTQSKNVSKAPVKEAPTSVPPGQGRSSTKARNQRRRSANILQRFKEKSILPAGATLAEFGRLDIDSNTTPEAAAEALAIARAEIEQEKLLGTNKKTNKEKSSKKETKDAEFEARRQELLASLATGGVDVGPITSSRTAQALPSSVDVEDIRLLDQSPPAPASATNEHPSEISSGRKKSKLDLGAGRRLLFGALGIKNPKNKAEEDKVRNNLMKDVRVLKTPESAMTEPTETTVIDEDPDAWREKITLRAVECCLEGQVLSEPPFPFVQRWDPQQQNHYHKGKRGGKGKRNQRDQYGEEEQPSSKKQKQKQDELAPNDGYADDSEEAQNGNQQANPDEIILEDETNELRLPFSDVAESQATMRDVQVAESQLTEQNDLPSLPADVSSLPSIDPKDMKPGMVVAFKQLIMSEATNWQPTISDYRTAVVNIILESNELELTLAMRDREYSEKYYNEETGERIYGKFDMPAEDEEQEEDQDDGYRIVGFSEAIEPKLVQAAPENLELGTASDKVITSTDESATLGPDQDHPTQQSIEDPPVADKDRTSGQDPDQPQTETDYPSHPPSESSLTLEADLPVDEAMPDVSISMESRQEISVMIKEAGFRSDIPSSVLRDRPAVPDVSSDGAEFNRLMHSMLAPFDAGDYSPKFNGLDSSPHNPPDDLLENQDQPSQLSLVEDEDASTPTPSAHYPRLSVPSSVSSQIPDRGERQPDFPTPGESTLDRFANSQLDDDDTLTSCQLNQGDQTDQTETFQHSKDLEEGSCLPPRPNERDSSSLSPISPSISAADSSASAEELPSLDEIFSTARSSTLTGREKSQSAIPPLSSAPGGDEEYRAAMAKLDADIEASSDPDESPKDEIQQAGQSERSKAIRIAAELDAGSEASSDPDENPKDETQQAGQSERSKAIRRFSAKLAAKWKREDSQAVEAQTTNEAETRRRSLEPTAKKSKPDAGSFVLPAGSQHVDLTLSSDAEPEPSAEKGNEIEGGAHDEDYELPKGPGWVKKRMADGSHAQTPKPLPRKRGRRRKTMKF